MCVLQLHPYQKERLRTGHPITLPRPGAPRRNRIRRTGARETGAPRNRSRDMYGNRTGYDVEFRLPLSLLRARRYFGVPFAMWLGLRRASAFAQHKRTGPPAESFNLVILRSRKLLNILGTRLFGSRIFIRPGSGVRAETGCHTIAGGPATKSDWGLQDRRMIRRF